MSAPAGAASSGTVADRAAGRAQAPNRRERARAATLEEIKQTALELMREEGTANVRFSDIARAMGLTAPALYRYFADRDELLTALVVDSFDHLATQLAAALDAAATDDLGLRLFTACTAYRRWASANPQRFSLLFGTPVPGYVAPEGPTLEAAHRAMATLQDLVLAAMRRGELRAPLVPEVGPAMVECAAVKAAATGRDIPPAAFQGMLHVWTTLHGFTSLEVYGHFSEVTPGARDELFAVQIRAAAMSAGLPVPPPLPPKDSA